MGVQIGSEGLEEAIQFGISREASHFADLALDSTTGDSSFSTRLRDYLKDPELWHSAVWGGIGGGVFHAAGSYLSNLGFKNSVEAERARLENYNQRAENVRAKLNWATQASLDDNQTQYNQAVNNFAIVTGKQNF